MKRFNIGDTVVTIDGICGAVSSHNNNLVEVLFNDQDGNPAKDFFADYKVKRVFKVPTKYTLNGISEAYVAYLEKAIVDVLSNHTDDDIKDFDNLPDNRCEELINLRNTLV